MSAGIEVELTSVPDRDDLVAELWSAGELVSEVRTEPEGLRVQFYPRQDGAPWDVDFEGFRAALDEAATLLSSDGQ